MVPRSSTERSPGRPREFDEAQVLEAAMEVFWRKGYESASLAELCQATGLHKGSLYQAFGDKHQLMMRALHHYSEMEFQECVSVMSDDFSPLENLRAIMHKVVEITGRNSGCLMVNTIVELAPHNEEVKRAVQTFGEKRIEAMAELLIAAQAAGEIRAELEPRKLAMHMMVTLAGTATLSKGFIDRAAADDIVDETINSWR